MREHYAVTWASTADAALSESASHPFDAVLCNLTLASDPGAATGRDVCRRLRELPGYTHVPIVALSAYLDTHAFASSVLAAEFDGCVGKPFTREQLVAALAHAQPRTPARR